MLSKALQVHSYALTQGKALGKQLATIQAHLRGAPMPSCEAKRGKEPSGHPGALRDSGKILGRIIPTSAISGQTFLKQSKIPGTSL